MARNGSGTMSVVNTFTPATTIESAAVNANFTDFASEVTNSLPRDGQAAMTGQLKAANGTVSLPGITFGSDPDTGFYRKSSNTIGVVVGGVEVAVIDSAYIQADLLSTNNLDDVADAATAARNLLNGLSTTQGNILYHNGTQWVALAVGTKGRVLRTEGAAANPTYGEVGHVCQGRLTAVSGNPLMTSTITPSGTVYFTPFNGNSLSLYTSSVWATNQFTELSLALSGGSASKPHDVFVYNNSGTATLEILAWTDGSNRATGLSYQDGRLVKSGDATRLYLGTIQLDSSKEINWQFGAAAAGGTQGIFHLWNNYNRRKFATVVQDNTDSWTYGSAAWRAVNNSGNNSVSVVSGRAEDAVIARHHRMWLGATGNRPAIGIGFNVTNAFSGVTSYQEVSSALHSGVAEYGAAFEGVRNFNAIEYSVLGTSTLYGDNGTAYIMGGLVAEFWA